MKTIKAIRKSKDVEIGEIKRVDDKTANNMVGSMWTYISKTEWKEATRKQTEKKINPKQELPVDEEKEFVKTRKKSK